MKENVMSTSTGEIIKQYLESNDYSLADLADASNVSLKTIYRVISDESKLSYEVAYGLNKLISEITVEFILGYDAKYQLEKSQFLSENNLTLSSCNNLVSKFHLKKLYPNWLGDNISLVKQGMAIFGKENFLRGIFEVNQLSNVAFSKANFGIEESTRAWLYTTYYECNDKVQPLEFNRIEFDKEFGNLTKLCGITNFETTIKVISQFCKKCGINFYFRKSIPNARVKAVTIKDKYDHIYIFMSDLFKCVENLWLAFIHECMHVHKGDLNTKGETIDNSSVIDERYVDDMVAEHLLGEQYFEIFNNPDINILADIAKKQKVPLGLVVEIYRFQLKDYTNQLYNQYLHFFTDKQVNAVASYF